MWTVQKKRQGFTLLELVMATATISILTSVVAVAINPQKSLSDAKNAARLHGIKEIESAMMQLLIDARNLPDLPHGKEHARDICRSGITGNNCSIDDEGIDLAMLAPAYLVSLPIDPDALDPRITGYRAYRDGAFAKACSPILDPTCGPALAIDPLCGNDVIDGQEECDDGSLNGVLCEAGIGQTCTYCSHLCRYITIENSICGNGILEGTETCDDGEHNGELCEPNPGESCAYCSTECDLLTVGGDNGGDTGGDCSASDCSGDPPAGGTYLCDDGSYAGPVCSLLGGTCQWTYRACSNVESSCTPITYAQSRVLSLWLDTSVPEPLLITEGKAAIEDGDTVMLWNDRHTSRNDVLQADPNRRPLYDADSASLIFDGEDDLLGHVGNVTDFEGTAIIVFASTALDTNPHALLSIDGAEEREGSFIALRAGIRGGLERGLAFGHNTSHGYFGLNTCQDVTGLHYLTWEYNASTVAGLRSTVWIDGKEQASVDVGASNYATITHPSTLSVGGLSDTLNAFFGIAPWKGYIKEVIVFREKLRNSERQCLDKYLQEKWGIAAWNDHGSTEGCVPICCFNPYMPGNNGCTCGDGALDLGEECDDGNLLNGDGCSAFCRPETLSSSSSSSVSSQPYDEYCGDGNIDLFEQCDDGNTIDGDGCSALCAIESVISSSSSSSASVSSSSSESYQSSSSSVASGVSSSSSASGGGAGFSVSSSQSSTYFGSSAMEAPGFPMGP